MALKLWTPLFDLEKDWRFDFPRLADFPFLGEMTGFDFRPSIDVVETEGELVVTAELPGIDPDDIDVALEGDFLVIQGEKTQRAETSDEDRYVRERTFGSFLRRIPLPEGTSADKMTATYDKGVLTIQITLPESKEREPRRIPVEINN